MDTYPHRTLLPFTYYAHRSTKFWRVVQNLVGELIHDQQS